MKSRLVFLLFLSCLTRLLFAQSITETKTIEKKITQLTVSREKSPNIDCYAINLQKNNKIPLFIIVPGSKCIPLFGHNTIKNRTYSTLMFYDALVDTTFEANFIAIERRNLKSFQEFSEDIINKKCSESYGSVDKKDRVEDVIAALKSIAIENWVGDIYLIGHSEGADVVSGVAKELGDKNLSKLKVKALCFLSSGGPTWFFDHIVEARLDSSQNVQAIFDTLLQFTDNRNLENYRGVPYQGYYSYAIKSTPLDELKNLDIPVFIAHGTADNNVSIFSDDLLVAELLRSNKKRKLKYLILNELDHGYIDTDGNSHSSFVLKDIFKWIEQGLPRQVETKSFKK